MRPNTPKRSGFTLIELLVVLGILGLLTAMLFPVFARAREKGRQTICLSNERQLGMAFLMYTHDNDGFCVSRHVWAGHLYPYVKSVEIYHCPSDATTAQPPYFPVSYGMNVNIVAEIDRPPLNPKRVALSASDVSNNTVLLFEVAHSTAQITTRDEGWAETATPLSASVEGNGTASLQADAQYATGALSVHHDDYYEGTGRHQDGANFLFADARAQWLPPGSVSADDNCWLDSVYTAEDGCAANSNDSAFAATFSPR